MARLIVTTCGTSLLTSSAWDDKRFAGCRPLAQISDRTERFRQEATCDAFTDDYARTKDYQKLAKIFLKSCWDNPGELGRLPAELASLRSLDLYLGKTAPLSGQDLFRFYYADNPEGCFCADCLKEILKINNSQLLPGMAKPDFREMRRLDPQAPEDFNRALTQLWDDCSREIKDLINTGAKTELIFNLTGGYKAVGYVLAGLAALRESSISITLVYLHETSYEGEIQSLHWDDYGKLEAGFYNPASDTGHLLPL